MSNNALLLLLMLLPLLLPPHIKESNGKARTKGENYDLINNLASNKIILALALDLTHAPTYALAHAYAHLPTT
jgi:hypothetical protein